MVKLKLVPYVLKIRNLDKSKRKNPMYEDLNTLDFAKLFQEFIKDNKSINIDETNEKIFSCDNCQQDKSTSIYYGNLGYGDYGYSAEIVSVKTKKTTKTKAIDEAEKIKFYYLMKIYDKEAYFLLNQFKHRGIKTQLGKQIKKYLDSKKVIADNFIVTLNPVVSSKLANIEKLQKIVFIRKRKSKDIEGQILGKIDNSEDETITEEKALKLKGDGATRFKQLIAALKKNYQENEYVEIDKQKYPTIKINVKMNDGSTKVIKLEADIKFNEGIEQEFEGDFPDIKDYFETAKPYFLKVIGEE